MPIAESQTHGGGNGPPRRAREDVQELPVSEGRMEEALHHTRLAVRALLEKNPREAEKDLRRALEWIQTLVQTPFQDLEIGDQFWNVGESQFGVCFEKTGERQCVQLTGQRSGDVNDHTEGTWLVWKVVKEHDTAQTA